MESLEALVHLAEVGTPPNAKVAARISAGLGETLRRVADETFPFVASGGADLQFIHAPYGRGKTHFLKALEHCARESGFVTAYVDCQDGQSPFKSLVETYRAVARTMTPPSQHRFFGTTGIAKVIEARFAGQNQEGQRALLQRIKADNTLTPAYRNLVTTYCTESVGGEGDEGLSESLEALLAATPSYRVTLGKLYRNYPYLPRPLGKLGRRNAGVWLRSVLSLPQVLGYPGLVVLFDETEMALARSSTRQRQQHLAHIRTFVDHMAVGAFRGCAIYYSVVEDFIEIAREHLAALSQRIERVRWDMGGVTRNPRAIWVDLDELTVPGPRDKRFFEELADRIVGLGTDAGLPSEARERVLCRLNPVAAKFEESILEGRVRAFVKEAAGMVAAEVTKHEGWSEKHDGK